MSFKTKSYKDRLQSAIDRTDKDGVSDLQAFKILYDVIVAEIAMVEKIESMSGFRAWFEGERFDLAAVKGRKKT